MSSAHNLKKTLLLLAAIPATLAATKFALDLRSSASGTPANIVIDTQKVQGPLPSSLWQNLAQGGEEPQNMLLGLEKKVAELNPKLIRIDHLYDYYGVYKSPGNYDFSKLDQYVQSILQTGAKPMLSISYVPASLSQNGQVAGEPSNWSEWGNLVQATAKHYSQDLNISDIYYEIYNEPDLFGGWKAEKSPSYAQLYTISTKAVVTGAGSASFKVGGPATTGFYENWFKSLFKTASQNNLRLDFISWHQYGKNIQPYLDNLEKLNKLLTAYPQYFNIERIVSETGPNSEPDLWYDNSLSGIHLLSLSTQLAGKIHKLFSFEIVDGPSARPNGSLGWGLISHPLNGANPKPRYLALQFLNQLTGNRLATSGDGSWVTSLAGKNGQAIQVLLVNYDQNNQHSETVPVTFDNLTPGSYQLSTKTYLDPQTRVVPLTVSSSTYTQQVFLEPNTAVLLTLSPLQ